MTKQLNHIEVIAIEQVGMGTRVCLDVIDKLDPQEGILVGNTGHGYIVVLSENRTTETYPARPFRINGGAFHQYVSIGENKTTYLSEIRPGMQLPIFKGDDFRLVTVGRVKIEKRKFVRIVCQLENKQLSATLQASDSVNLLTDNGDTKSVLDLKIGDRVLCMPDDPGRHLGEKIEEEIEEY